MQNSRRRLLGLLTLVGFLTAIGVWVFDKVLPLNRTPPTAEHKQNIVLVTETPTQLPTPAITPSISPPPEPVASPTQSSYVGQLDLIVPVAGVRRDQLLDTFSDSRSEGRVHDAIDIPAAANTPVLAAADGEIVKLFQSERGGTTIYQTSSDNKLIFYYAHLAGYADGVVEGKKVRQGETIAYVGDSGNAGAGNFHLHFSIAVVDDPKRYWEGTNVNPYPLLHR
jgi:murein DD-endopeptidase MepM/ murein hydrolase activator NlpD